MKKLDLIEDRWLSIKEIAEYLGVLWQTVCVYFEKKNFSGYRIGKFRKFKIAEVDAGYIPDSWGGAIIDFCSYNYKLDPRIITY